LARVWWCIAKPDPNQRIVIAWVSLWKLSMRQRQIRWQIFMFALCITNIKTLFIFPTGAHYISPLCTTRLHNGLICCHNIDCICTDEHT
jgi:hypothetical protein